MHCDRGFTLMEMLIAVAIIAVLIAIAIPTSSYQIAQAKASADMANVRSAEAAATLQFMTDTPDEDTTYYFDAAHGSVTTDPVAAAKIAGYGQSNVEVDGATGIPNQDGEARIVLVAVRTAGTYTATWKPSGDNAAFDSLITTATAIKDGYTGYHSNDDLINDAGPLPSMTAAQLCELLEVNALYQQTSTSKLYWRPYSATIDGKTSVFLYANTDSTGHANWQGFAIYYNGRYYKSTNINSYSGSTDHADIQSFSTYLASGIGSWKKVG